jgi:primosomal protein N''
LEAREILRQWGFLVTIHDRSHRDVRLRFSYAADTDLNMIGDMLDRLGQVRNRADYELNPAPWFATKLKAQEAITRAETAIQLIDQIEAAPLRRAAAIAAIQQAFP